MTPIAIYDDNCSACTTFSTLGRGITPLGYSTPKAKKLMKAQFGEDYGFILMYFTDDKVYWGKDAVSQITTRGYAKILSGFAHFAYPAAVKSLNFLLRRKRLPTAPSFNHKKLPDSGSMKLTTKAKSIISQFSY